MSFGRCWTKGILRCDLRITKARAYISPSHIGKTLASAGPFCSIPPVSFHSWGNMSSTESPSSWPMSSSLSPGSGRRHRILAVVWGRNREPNWFSLRWAGVSVVPKQGAGIWEGGSGTYIGGLDGTGGPEKSVCTLKNSGCGDDALGVTDSA
jgi:hypothetical protein